MKNFLALTLANAVPFCSHDCSRHRPDSLKILTGAAKILSNSLHIRERQECSGVRRSSRKRTTIRRTPPGVLACFNLFLDLAKASGNGSFGFPGRRDGRRPSPWTGVIAFFFRSFFSIDFWKALFRFLMIFGPPWGPPKSQKSVKVDLGGLPFFELLRCLHF